MVRIALFLLLGAVAAPSALAGSVYDAIATVYVTSPRLDAARARLRAADENLPQARAIGRPSLSTTSSAGLAQVEDSDGSRSMVTTNNALTLRQPVYTGGELAASLRRAREAILAERARLALTEQEIILATAEAYAGVLLARRAVAIAAASEARHAQELSAAAQRFRLGDATSTDVAQAESRAAGATARRELAAGDLEVAEADYARLVGEPPPPELLDLPGREGLPPSLADALDLVAEHPAVRAAAFEADSARADIDVARSELRPRLAITGRVGYSDLPESSVGSQADASIAAVLSVPLYQGGSEHAKVRQSKQTFFARRHDLDAVRRGIERDVTAAWRSRETAIRRVQTIRRQSRAAGIALDGIRQEALLGTRPFIDLLDAEDDLASAELAHARAAIQATLADWQLAAAVGDLAIERLPVTVELYDPELHLEDVGGRWFGSGPDLREQTRTD